jgi:uncharacterized membrane protein YdjX (TVP38/TMEM64 family)
MKHHGRVTTAARGIWLRAAVLVVVLLAGVGAALAFDLPSVAAVRSWIDGAGFGGLAALTLGYALVMLAPVPRSALSVLVGVVAGFWTGVGIAFTGGLLAALVAFGLSRALGRSAVLRLAGPRLTRVDGAVSDRSFLAVLTGRLVPVVPFVVTSYGAGLTGVRFAPYVLATALGLVPSTLLQVGLGASAGLLVDRMTASVVVPVAALGLVAAVLGAALWRRRRAAVPA